MSLALSLIMLAQSLPYNGAECNQAEADKGIQFEMNVCAAERFRAADRELNAAWGMAAHVAKDRDAEFGSPDEPSYFAILLEAQRAWLLFRDAHCKVEADRYRGGSIRPLIYSSCKEGLTRQRTQQLRDYLREG